MMRPATARRHASSDASIFAAPSPRAMSQRPSPGAKLSGKSTVHRQAAPAGSSAEETSHANTDPQWMLNTACQDTFAALRPERYASIAMALPQPGGRVESGRHTRGSREPPAPPGPRPGAAAHENPREQRRARGSSRCSRGQGDRLPTEQALGVRPGHAHLPHPLADLALPELQRRGGQPAPRRSLAAPRLLPGRISRPRH